MYLTMIKFKNFLLVDLSTGEILFDMQNVRVSVFIYLRDLRNIKIFKRIKSFGRSYYFILKT
jgi:hypothetical protein